MPWKLVEISNEQVNDFGRRFKQKGRFLVDESAGEGLARAMRDAGWNAVYVGDVGLAGHADEEVFALAWREQRVLLTHDRDFLDDRRFPFHRTTCVVVLPGASGPARGFIEAAAHVSAVIGGFRKAFQHNKIEITEDQVWTIRGFDKKLGRHFKNRFRFDRHGETWIWEEPTDPD